MHLLNKQIISFDGNIGSGKSSLVNALENELQSHENICFLQEPVNIWNTIRDKENKTILENYYENQHKYAFSFQMMAYISRLHMLKEAVSKG